MENTASLTTLDCGYYKATHAIGELPNNFGIESVEYIRRFLEKNKSVQYFSLENNFIELPALSQIVDSFELNQTICLFIYGQGHLRTSTDKNLNERIKKLVDANSYKIYNCNAERFKKDHIRILKHTNLIYNIDSVYRNNM